MIGVRELAWFSKPYESTEVRVLFYRCLLGVKCSGAMSSFSSLSRETRSFHLGILPMSPDWSSWISDLSWSIFWKAYSLTLDSATIFFLDLASSF